MISEERELRIQAELRDEINKLFVKYGIRYQDPVSSFEGIFYGWFSLAIEVRRNQPDYFKSFINNVWNKLDRIIKSSDPAMEATKVRTEMENDPTRT